MNAYIDQEFGSRLSKQLTESGLETFERLEGRQLFGLDQFHAGGPEPVLRLIQSAGLDENSRVLDLGSGLGGPARLIASQTGATVLGVDATPAYVEAAQALTVSSGLDGKVSFVEGDITKLDLEDGSFDAAALVHVQMNIRDKVGLFQQIQKVLRPGGKLLMWEVASSDPSAISWPVPWSLDGSDSYLVSEDELRGAAESAGLVVDSWQDRSSWTREWAVQLQQQGPPPGPSLPAVLIDGPQRIANFGRAVVAGQVTMVEAVLHA